MNNRIKYKDRYYGPNRYFYEENKTIIQKPSRKDLVFSSPEHEGMSKWGLKVAELSLKWRPYIKSFLVSRNSKIIWESYLHHGKEDHCDNIHSVSKSIISALVGILIDQRKLRLEDYVCDIIPEYSPEVLSDEFKLLKIKHLLTMTSGFSWEEDSTEFRIEKKDHWIKSILNRKTLHTPGVVFNYNTGLSHVLSAIITKVSGVSTCEFAFENLFKKLNMNPAQWSWDPNGYFCGGFNFYMAPLDLLRFSLCYLNHGETPSGRVLSKDWIERSMRPLASVDGISYGYYWWVDSVKGYHIYYAWGYGGQFIYIIPKLKVTVVITSDTMTYNKDYNARNLIRKHIIPSVVDYDYY